MLSDKHKEDLYNSGLEDNIIEEIGFYTCNEKEANLLLDRRDIDCQCLVFPYPDVEDYYRLKPDGIITDRQGKPAKYLQRGGSESRLFIHKAVREAMHSTNGNAMLPLLIVEGEKKTAKATQDLFFKEKLFYPIGISGVYNWKTRRVIHSDEGDKTVSDYISDLKKLVIDNRLVYICFDSNKEINQQVREAENELGKYLIARGATRVLNIRIPHDDLLGKHGIGLDDYLVKNGVEKFKVLITNADSTETLRHSIKFIRKLPNRSYYEKTDEIVALILKDLSASGSFYFDTNWIYYFNNSTKIMLQVEEDIFAMKLATDYGLYRDSNEFKAIVNKIEEYARFNGSQITIKNVSFFNKETQSLFVYGNKGVVFEIISEVDIRQRFNGYKDIFFKHRHENSVIDYKEKSEGYFERHILDVANFQHTEYTKLTPEQQRFLFTVWFYSLFFPNLLPTKPILVMTGDYGSGKSTIQRLIGKLLFGSNFNVSTIQGERDFLTSIINKYYLVYDNVDINEEWVRNAIASLSTGFKVEVRKMYSNMEIFQADPIAYLAMNSMTQGLYKRPDIASRLLIFRTKRINGPKIPETILHGNIEENRNEILSEVFDNLKGIIKYIDDKFSYFGSFRMADFANLGYKIATYFGREKEFEVILDIMSMEQSSLPLEDNPLIDILDKWLNHRLRQEYLTTGELYAQLQKISDDTGLFFPFKSSVSFGKNLQTSLENLKLFYDIASQRSSGNRIKWLINFKEKKEN